MDMSESGVGVVVQGEDASRIMDVLSQIAADIQRIHTPLDVEIELPRDGTVRAKGELKNIIGGQGNVYVRLGLKINLEENQRKKIRQYIMRRQREILDQLKSL